MIRWFFFLAVPGVIGLLAGPVLGPRAALTGAAAVAGLHGMVWGHLAATGRRAREVARREGLPDRFLARSERNRRRASPFAVGGAVTAAVAAGTAFAGAGIGSTAASALALGFNLGAFAVESIAIAGQDRLIAGGR